MFKLKYGLIRRMAFSERVTVVLNNGQSKYCIQQIQCSDWTILRASTKTYPQVLYWRRVALQEGYYCILEGWPHKRGLTEQWKGGIIRGSYCIVGGVALQEGDYCIAEGKGWFYKRGTIALQKGVLLRGGLLQQWTKYLLQALKENNYKI